MFGKENESPVTHGHDLSTDAMTGLKDTRKTHLPNLG
jgi:hypothetical protein